MTQRNTWALVLAAGDGTRLSAMTRDASGNAVPKQYCSLNGSGSLLFDALGRARHVAPRERQCLIVSASHEKYWSRIAGSVPAGNVIVQPRNCGTANGILLAVLHILALDPLADIVFLPSDHFVRDESLLAGSLRVAAAQLQMTAESLVLIGIEPDEADPELGYIVPGIASRYGSQTVARFVEKPHAAVAAELIASGAVWNSFIFAAHGPALLGLLRAHMPTVVEDMATALVLDERRGGEPVALTLLYDELPSVDFSRTIIQGAGDQLRVVTAPACGWSDLGTPRRVAQALRRVEPARQSRWQPRAKQGAFINLAVQHAQLSLAG